MISTGNPLLTGASGKLSNIIVKQYGNKTVITSVPDMSRRKLSAKQKEQNDRMKMAIFYAKSITSNASLKQRAFVFLKVPPNKVFRALVSHFLVTDHIGDSWLFPETPQERLDEQIRKELKATILSIIPDATIMLFGDKTKGSDDPHSHWDILILANGDQPAELKWDLHEKLFAITARQGSNINMMLLPHEKWETGTEYEILKKRIEGELVVLT
ncbi:MAG: hypothetical protein DI535_20010 [Citrobacter freundii]|nr:MAG: hypothetical protein DI535_20010 [Citrobacter freundii]